MSQDLVRNVIIIGSGPAGYTAAIYASRANLDPLLFEGEPDQEKGTLPGGQLMITTDVENFPGFPEGVLGPDMMEKFKAQAQRFGTEMRTENVTAVNFDVRPFEVMVGETTYRSHAVIIATGATAKLLGLENEKRLMGHGVSACATCDGAFFRNKEVHLVGGGDTAMEEAIFLTRFAKKVSVVHRREELRASKIMQERAKSNEKIHFVWNAVVVDVLDAGTGKVTALVLENTQTGEREDVPSDGLFVAIGHQPNTSLFEGKLTMDDVGYIQTQGKSSKTNIEGVFACGDVQDATYRQAVTAAGSGCTAAIDAERWLEVALHEASKS
ncbi:MAG: thioredoxin-disulfide reductase [Planctomycetes bacterium]|nr:thioredoxin-disulfide reductase [Planctomycetota bacterium]